MNIKIESAISYISSCWNIKLQYLVIRSSAIFCNSSSYHTTVSYLFKFKKKKKKYCFYYYIAFYKVFSRSRIGW